jgi:long-chain acyl-CoA synthetase
MNLAQHLRRNAAIDPDGAALALGREVTANWRVMAERVARLAGGFAERFRLEPAARIALFMGNAPVYAEIAYAAWWGGYAVLPINAKLHARELAYILDHSAAAIVLTDAAHAEIVAAAHDESRSNAVIIDVASQDFARLLACDPRPMVATAPVDLAWLFYTSGTTGRPKGAMLSHRNLLAMALSYAIDIDPPHAPGAQLHAAPMSHGSGLYMLPSLMQRHCQVVPPSGGFDPSEIIDMIAAWPGLSMFAAPTMVKRLVESPAARHARVENLRVIVWGGAPMYVEDVKAAIAALGYRFAQLYGQGESPMTITGMTRAMLEDAHRRGDEAMMASAGIAQSVIELRIADSADAALPVGEAGEILARGDSVMSGYWRNPEASAAALRGGWLHTGDIGRVDARGLLMLMDRSKDLIISGGANIYPREVEEILLRHESVSECAVIGVPDRDWGESVLAFVVLRERHPRDREALDRLCLDNIARFKRPKDYRFIAALPKNSYGKILKSELRRLAATLV